MRTAYKINARFVVTTEHSCDCEFCEHDGQIEQDEALTETLIADDVESAKRQFAEMIRDDLDRSNGLENLRFEVLDEFPLPENAFIFHSDREIVLDDGRYFSDGFVALESELSCFVGGGRRIESTIMLPTELSHPLGRFAHDDEGRCVFDDVVFNGDYVKELHRLGISVWALINQSNQAPYALEKHGRLVGWIMPIFSIAINRRELISRGNWQYQLATPAPADTEA